MTREELIDIIREAEQKADNRWWSGERTPFPDGQRIDEKNRRRRLAILDAIEPIIRAEVLGHPKQPCTGTEFLDAMAMTWADLTADGVTVDPSICRQCGLFESICICDDELNGPGGSE